MSDGKSMDKLKRPYLESSKIKMLAQIKNGKEVQKNFTFAYDFIEMENKNNEVLECLTIF